MEDLLLIEISMFTDASLIDQPYRWASHSNPTAVPRHCLLSAQSIAGLYLKRITTWLFAVFSADH